PADDPTLASDHDVPSPPSTHGPDSARTSLYTRPAPAVDAKEPDPQTQPLPAAPADVSAVATESGSTAASASAPAPAAGKGPAAVKDPGDEPALSSRPEILDEMSMSIHILRDGAALGKSELSTSTLEALRRSEGLDIDDPTVADPVRDKPAAPAQVAGDLEAA